MHQQQAEVDLPWAGELLGLVEVEVISAEDGEDGEDGDLQDAVMIGENVHRRGAEDHERGHNERATDDQRLAEEEDDRARGIVDVQKSNHGRVSSQLHVHVFVQYVLVRSVVGVIAIGRWRILYGVEHETDDVGCLELMLRALRNGVAGNALTRDEQNGVAGTAHADGVRDGDHGRGVDDDPVEVFIGDAEHLLKAGLPARSAARSPTLPPGMSTRLLRNGG